MGSRDQMRAADADREQYAAQVRKGLEEGRLTLSEMDERLRDVYGAKTFGDLDRLVSDLPGLTPQEQSQVAPAQPAAPIPPSRHEPNPKLAPWLSFLWRVWLVVVLVNLVIWFVASIASAQFLYFWPIWVALPWGAVNVGLTIIFPPAKRG